MSNWLQSDARVSAEPTNTLHHAMGGGVKRLGVGDRHGEIILCFENQSTSTKGFTAMARLGLLSIP